MANDTDRSRDQRVRAEQVTVEIFLQKDAVGGAKRIGGGITREQESGMGSGLGRNKM